jgi:predicted ATPase/DNA-binding CsgD family transcriptional regulator
MDRVTDRELEILKLLASGASDREISLQLSLSINTVKWYNKRIYRKLGVGNRTEATARAHSLGFLSEEQTEESLAQTPLISAGHLPAQITSFVGRQREMDEIVELLETSRLITIRGAAGTGKTRLALQIAVQQKEVMQDGVFFIPLTTVKEPEDILWSIAEHIGFQFNPHKPPLDQLLDHFPGKTIMLILDAFEHLVSGANVLSDLLVTATDLHVLVTSRERLNLYGETCYVLEGMSLPETSDYPEIRKAESTQLFLQRAQAVRPNLDFSKKDLVHIARICRLVGGLPLAIELAATWVDILSMEEIAEEIKRNLDILSTEKGGIPPNQRSMRAAFRRSWTLLEENQKQAFRRLAIFQGGFTREGASIVAGVDLRTLQALVAKSLLRAQPNLGRYEMHDLLRQFALEKLISSGEVDDLSLAHAAYFADFMAERWPQMKGPGQQRALNEIERDLENAREAWDTCIARRDWKTLRGFLHSFWVIHDIRGWYPAGLRLFERATEVLREDPSVDAKAALGWLLSAQGLFCIADGYSSRKGYQLAREGVALLNQLESDQEMVIPLISLFITATRVNENNVAADAAQNCLLAARRLKDAWGVAKAEQLLAILAIEGGDYERARSLAEDALHIFEQRRDRWSESILCIEVMGLQEISLGNYEGAKSWIERGLTAAQEIGFRYSVQLAYWQLGYIEALQERYSEAGNYWQKAMRVGERVIGSKHMIGFGGVIRSGEWAGRELSPHQGSIQR